MLIHLTPKVFSKNFICELVDFTCLSPSFKLELDTRHLTARKPYSNQLYSVVCSRKSRKAYNGILIETSDFVDKFKTVTRWRCMNSIVVHTVNYVVLDEDFDCVTEDALIWLDRKPNQYRNLAPVVFEPKLKIDTEKDLLLSSTQRLVVPTVSKKQLFSKSVFLTPSEDQCFRISN